MRRLLVNCAVAGLAIAGGALAWSSALARPRPAHQSAAATTSSAANSAGSATSAKPIVIARGVQARALALMDAHASDSTSASTSASQLYLTTATSPNRVLTLGGFSDASASASAASNSFNPVAELLPFAGSGQTGSLGDAGTALFAQFKLSTDSLAMRSGVVVAPDGTVFVADTMNATIRRISSPNSAQPGIITSIAGRWADSTAAGSAGVTLKQPMALALDRLGNLFISDYAANAVAMLPDALSAVPGALRKVDDLRAPASIAVAPDGSELYVSSLEFGGLNEIGDPRRTLGMPDAISTSRPASYTRSGSEQDLPNNCVSAAQPTPLVDCVAGVAVDGGGNVFFAWANAGFISRIAKTGAVRTVATKLLAPGDMTFDDKGNLFVSEQGRAQILEFKGMGVPVSNLSVTAPAPLPPPPAPQVCTALVNQPSAFSFCDEPIAGATPAQTFTLTNLSGSEVTGVTIAVSPASTPSNFTILGTTCPPALNAGASCSVQVEFTPQTSGELDASLTVTDNQGDSSSSSIGGTGIDYQLVLATGQSMQMNVYQGSSVSFNLQVVPIDAFADTVTFVCPPPALGKTLVNGSMPPYTTCAFTPATAPVTPGTPVAFSVKFTTTLNFIPPPVTTPTGGIVGPFGTRPLTGAQRAILFPALAIFGLAALAWVVRRPEKRAARIRYAMAAMALGAVVCGVGAMSACHKTPPNPAIQTTPTGTTTMNVTATSQGASRGVPITLQVIPIP